MSKSSARKRKSRQKILGLLKTHGPLSAVELSQDLGLSAMAVRQHLYALAQEKLVSYEEEARKVNGRSAKGRPVKLWQLTIAADEFFPDGHGAFSVELIESLRKVFGEKGMERLLESRAKDQIAQYGRELKSARSLPKRLQALAGLRSREGYMAEVVAEGRDEFLLLEHHCPICSAAKSCTGICARELEVFQKVLGTDVSVERESHILAGATRCAYRVSRNRR
jgi:predicted ArsR family transcriptional regulator